MFFIWVKFMLITTLTLINLIYFNIQLYETKTINFKTMSIIIMFNLELGVRSSRSRVESKLASGQNIRFFMRSNSDPSLNWIQSRILLFSDSNRIKFLESGWIRTRIRSELPSLFLICKFIFEPFKFIK